MPNSFPAKSLHARRERRRIDVEVPVDHAHCRVQERGQLRRTDELVVGVVVQVLPDFFEIDVLGHLYHH